MVEPGKKTATWSGLRDGFGNCSCLEVIATNGQNFERGHGVAQFDGGIEQPLLGDIDRDISDRVLELLEQHARLDSGARAETDQLDIRANRFRHLASVALQQLRLRARDVILGQFADFLEEIGAALIVKKFARERAR